MANRDYKEDLYKELLDLDYASGYLSECYELGMDEFLLALKDIVEANGGVGQISKNTGLNRESLYRLLSEKGNPRLSSLNSILDALGLKINFSIREEDEKEAA